MAFEIRRARAEDIPALKEIYTLAFDAADEAELVFGRLPITDCFAALDGGVPAAMAFALPCTLDLRSGAASGVYIYAVATHPSMRGKGLSTALLEYIWQDTAGSADIALLCPASESLFGFYAARGYSVAGSAVRMDDSAAAAAVDVLPEIVYASPEEYLSFRERYLTGSVHAVWDASAIAFRSDMLGLYGGGLALIGRVPFGCCAWSADDGKTLVKELLAPPERLPTAFAAVLKHTGAEHGGLLLESRHGRCLGGEPEPYIMTRCRRAELEPRLEGLYTALVLD